MQQTWFDGDLVESRNNVEFRTHVGALVERYTFRNFHGGSTDRFRPSQTQFTWCGSPQLHTAHGKEI